MTITDRSNLAYAIYVMAEGLEPQDQSQGAFHGLPTEGFVIRGRGNRLEASGDCIGVRSQTDGVLCSVQPL